MSTTDTLYREKADEKSAPLQFTVTDHGHAQIVSEAPAFGDLHRSFTPRQVHIISLGSNVGSGLFIATGKALANGGPGTMSLAYLMVCSGVRANLQTLGEMTIAFPTSGNYVDYAGRWVDPALAFGAGFAQWLGWTAVLAAEADFFVVLVDYWTAGVVPMAVWRKKLCEAHDSQIAKSKPKSKPSPSQSQSPDPSTSTTTPPSSSSAAQQKYLRRAELEAAREAAYAAEQARIEAERLERASKKRKLEDEEAERAAVREEKKRRLAEESRKRREQQEREEERKRRKRLGLPDLPDPSLAIEDGTQEGTTTTTTLEDIPDDELRSKLRSLNEPAALYDETHASRLKRYRTLVSTAQTLSLKPKLSDGPIPTTLEPIPEKDMLLPATVPAPNTPEHTFLYRQLASYFTLLLREWSIALSQRDASVKASHSGKAAATSYLQVLKDLTPLFRRFERADLEHNLLEPICQIVRCAQNRRYVEANDKYLTLSIGKAAWPIGVTMVGIHERSAREKLSESGEGKQAHIMTDEVTRKYLQSIKRCLSFAQTRWPPEDLGQLMG
ncbi:hypothetical protein LTR67_004381 [Exophiala xenobiotica]